MSKFGEQLKTELDKHHSICIESFGITKDDGVKDFSWIEPYLRECGYTLELHQGGIQGTSMILSPIMVKATK